MGWEYVHDQDEFSVSVDKEKGLAMLELSSSGIRPKYVSLQLEHVERLDAIVQALQAVRPYLKSTANND
ncbi:hypothetical protein ACFFK0_13540 [Paenibacillus chartarius]|uniref:Uncharacterized protein n=1 Tax=Paenibacillus chartarius TaxID=747481 RepID=A0ABV6DLD6_9BACL